MTLKVKVARNEAVPKTYPISEMEVGGWAIIVSLKVIQRDRKSGLVNHPVTRLCQNLDGDCEYRVLLPSGKHDMKSTNYLVRSLEPGEKIIITEE